MKEAYNKRKLGAEIEQFITQYLTEQGFCILETNYRCRQGEIDIIAKDDTYYVFIEVKYRKSTAYGLPQEAVGYSKQRRICKVAQFYLYEKHLPETTPVRFDVAAVLNDKVSYFKDAFSFT